MKKYLRKYLKYVKPYYKLQLITLMFVLISSVLGLQGPIIMKIVIDNVLLSRNYRLLTIILFIMVGLFILNSFINFINEYLTKYIAEMISINMRAEVFSKIQRMKIKYTNEQKIGDLMNRIIGDVGNVTMFLSNTYIIILSNIFNIITALILIISLNYRLAIMNLIIVPIYTFIYLKFMHLIRNNEKRMIEKSSEHYNLLKEFFSNIKLTKLFNSEKKNENVYLDLLNNLMVLSFRSFNTHYTFNTLLSSIYFIFELLILIIGVKEISLGRLSIGGLLVFNSLVSRFFAPVKNFININVEFQRVFVSIERIEEIVNIPTEDTDNELTRTFETGDIVFKNVSFKYDSINVLKNIDLKIKNGEKVAIIGPSGSGKSTITNLLLRLYDLEDGDLLINNININEYSIPSLRDGIGLISQDILLFDTSIKDNICFGSDLSDEEVFNICKKIGIHDFILSLPQQYNTVIGNNGVKLSGGQKQLLSIARLLTKNPYICILDEATSSVDKQLEINIYKLVFSLFTDKTIIIIAHNQSAIRYVDKIIILDQGEIIAVGTHEQLISHSSFYTSFYNSNIKENNLLRGDLYDKTS